jgi:uracil-DNA glycosylase
MAFQQQHLFSTVPASWQQPLEQVCNGAEINELAHYLQERKAAGAIIYPSQQNIFAALQATPFNRVNVVIVGQDPYHGPGQAHGLSFSVPAGISIPPSLRNIFKELSNDIGMPRPAHGTLTGWASQGVLLLNAILTVEKGKPAAHAKKGWEFFTDAIIEQLLKRPNPTVFMLWGAYAQKKFDNLHAQIDPTQHLILKAAHPSPLSVKGFSGCRHFSQANQFLKKHLVPEINWYQISSD